MKIAILDGYVDEPSCLGVPPYVSPYPRYIYGMIKSLGLNSHYFTIDQYRNKRLFNKLSGYDLLIVIAGAIVPGKYINAKPITLEEIRFLPEKPEKAIVGPIALEIGLNKKNDVAELDFELEIDFELDSNREGFNTSRLGGAFKIFHNTCAFEFPFETELFEFLKKFTVSGCGAKSGKLQIGSSRDFDTFSILGAQVVRQHPQFPYIICEMETYRGCYWRKCSFCMEGVHGNPKMRPPEWVLKEFEALYNQGVRYFRIGRQTDFLTYMADFSQKKSDFPVPNPEFMLKFHKEIWKRCPEIKTLHLDNINPKTIAEHPEESEIIIKTIVSFQTPGNVGAMGLESADEKVVEANNLAATPDEVMFAIKLVNRYGARVGYNGLPSFLPGINFVTGLKGENNNTFQENIAFLKKVMDNGLLLRRINVRQVKTLKGAVLASNKTRKAKKGDKAQKRFKEFKRKVREDFEKEMLKNIVPIGRKLTDLKCEFRRGNITFARQLATYPLLVGLLGEVEGPLTDAKIVGYGYRSVTGVPFPLDVNKANIYQISGIPGIGKNTAARIIAKRPFKDIKELLNIIPEEAANYFTCNRISE